MAFNYTHLRFYSVLLKIIPIETFSSELKFQSHKTCSRHYFKFLERTGFSISICQCRWYSTLFNRSFVRIGQWRPRLLRLWFTVGVLFGLVAMLLSVCLLTLLVINTLRKEPVEQQVLTPVVCFAFYVIYHFIFPLGHTEQHRFFYAF